ncbi:hypothetical protein AGMMS49579_26590 [Spirochaetia bacterium]|nr:hypothetical protein AGMMS49579_26590 [Spirochaetia bacterium]
MKKLSVSKALMGLFVVLAVGIGLAACEFGDYELTEEEDGIKSTYKLTLSSPDKYKFTVTASGSGIPQSVLDAMSFTDEGTYTRKGSKFTFKSDKGNREFSGELSADGKTLKMSGGGDLKKKSVDGGGQVLSEGDVFEVEWVD